MIPLFLLMQAGGTALNVAGNLDQASQEAAQARANQKFALGQAADAYRLGAWRAAQLRTRGSQMVGAQKSGYAASGVEATQGTPLQTMAGTRFLSDLDIQTAHNNAARRAWGYQTEANQYGRQAQLDEQRGFYGALGAGLGGAGGMLGTLGNAFAARGGYPGGVPNIADSYSARLRAPSGGYY